MPSLVLWASAGCFGLTIHFHGLNEARQPRRTWASARLKQLVLPVRSPHPSVLGYPPFEETCRSGEVPDCAGKHHASTDGGGAQRVPASGWEETKLSRWQVALIWFPEKAKRPKKALALRFGQPD